MWRAISGRSVARRTARVADGIARPDLLPRARRTLAHRLVRHEHAQRGGELARVEIAACDGRRPDARAEHLVAVAPLIERMVDDELGATGARARRRRARAAVMDRGAYALEEQPMGDRPHEPHPRRRTLAGETGPAGGHDRAHARALDGLEHERGGPLRAPVRHAAEAEVDGRGRFGEERDELVGKRPLVGQMERAEGRVRQRHVRR